MVKKKVKNGQVSHLVTEKLVKVPEVLEELETLFDLSPPSSLKRILIDLFFAYMCNMNCQDYKPEMKEICNDFYCLIKFLEAAENYEQEYKFATLLKYPK
jgi:hypothetical protein